MVNLAMADSVSANSKVKERPHGRFLFLLPSYLPKNLGLKLSESDAVGLKIGKTFSLHI